MAWWDSEKFLAAALGLGLAAFLALASLGLDPGVILVCFALLAAALLAFYSGRAQGLLAGLGRPQAACLALSWLLWASGSCLSASAANMSWLCSGLLALGGLAWLAGSSRGLGPEPGQGPAPAKAWLAAALGLAFAMALGLVWIYIRGMVPAFSTQLFFMPRSLAGYESIPSAPFRDFSLLAAPALFWAMGLAGLAWLWSKRRGWILPALFATGFMGKIMVASISGSGLAVLPQQITAISTAFYNLGAIPHNMGVWPFICHFNDMQARLSTHGETHPFGGELYYLGLVKLLGANPWHVALAVSAVAGLGVTAVYQLAEEIFGDLRLALAASLLYLASPANMILDTSGIDSTFSVLFAYGILLLLKGLRQKDARLLAAAGLLGWIMSLFSLAASYYFLMGAYLFYAAWQERRDGRGLLKEGLAFGGLALGLHLALWLATGGQFHYWEVFRVARPVQEDLTRARPYFLWVWLDLFLFLGYAGLANVGLGALALARRVGRPALWGGFWAASLGLAAMIFIQSLGNGEVQRMDHFLYLFVALWAAQALGKSGDKNWLWSLALLATLNFATSLILEALVMDYW